ncbi:hypothetical protein C7B62_01870 [Pleurocapsa sp. CCALA 161]|uniref:hypothetical protein n=1 Tax=Pleurocapsa sp. CCALA 161 TaxID=2107688 RepID=UPI000D04B951|nr:hypothetical protein [Pleurocapsa sp. CCALA 161]PSB12384.1 hypothetical protein C7B62_01870 [Pleurocapsa sp. CCALA 161]
MLNNHNHRGANFCLGISLLVAFYYGFCFYYFVFNQEYIVQDDARQHVVWLQRFVDADLFRNDLIANYFSSLAPIGFKFLYLFAAKLGIEPILFAKLLPPVLAGFTTIYIYWFTLQIFSLPLAGFISSLLINQLIWLNDDLVSATPRAFIYPLLAAFLYYLSLNSLIPCLILLLLQGIFYPHIILIEMVILSLRLIVFQSKKNRNNIISFTNQKKYYIWWIIGFMVTAIALYPLTQKPAQLATTVTALQMQQMPEFNLGGRSPFFGVGFLKYWLAGSSGLTLPLFPTIVWSGLILPWVLNKKIPISKLTTKNINILIQVTIASLLMFFLAHLLLPKLHLPSRYTYHTIQFVLAISSGIVLTIYLNSSWQWLKNKQQFNLLAKTKITLITLFALTVVIFPAIPYISINWFQDWRVGTAKEIYQYLAQQPKDILVASLSIEVNNIPAFSQRSILVGDEFALAYHPAYYEQIKQRTVDLLQAQYSHELKNIQSFIQQYHVNYLLLDHDAFTTQYLLNKNWLINSSWSKQTQQAIAQLKSKYPPALIKIIPSCLAVSTDTLKLLKGSCLLEQQPNQSQLEVK